MGHGQRALRLAAAAALLAALPAVDAGAAASDLTARVSLAVSGEPNDASTGTDITPNGRYVAFESDASNLVPGDTNEVTDVFVRDRVAGTTERVSVATGGGQADDASYSPSISSNGCRIAFVSDSDLLAAADGNGASDAYVRDRCAGTTQLVSIHQSQYDQSWNNGVDPDERVAISGNGTKVVFATADGSDEGWGSDANGEVDIYVRDLSAAKTWRISSTAFGGVQGTISEDGTKVAYVTAVATQRTLIPDCRGECYVAVVYVRNPDGTSPQKVSLDTGGGNPDAGAFAPSLSRTGRYVAFASAASDLVAGDANGLADVYVRDRQGSGNVRVSVDRGGGDANGLSGAPALSPDGSAVGFTSFASDLVRGDGNAAGDVFVRDLGAAVTRRASADVNGRDANGASTGPGVDEDGTVVSFASAAGDLVAGDGNGVDDVFVRDLSDTTAPGDPAVTAPGASPWTLQTAVPVAWSASDPSGIAFHDVQRRSTRWNASPGSWDAWQSATPSAGATYTGARGRTHCFRSSAQDAAGNVSAWSEPGCVAIPLTASSLDYSSGWRKVEDAALYGGAGRRSDRKGARARLDGVRGTRFVLVATTCPTCGRVKVLLDGAKIASIDLQSSTTRRGRLLPIATYGAERRGDVVVEVTTDGKPVVIEGFGASNA